MLIKAAVIFFTASIKCWLYSPNTLEFALASFTSFTLISADWSLEASIGWGAVYVCMGKR